MFFGYLDPENVFLKIMKTNDLLGDLANTSAKKEPLFDRNRSALCADNAWLRVATSSVFFAEVSVRPP